MGLLKHIISLESLKNFFKVRDENDELDREQVKATAIQTAFILISFTVVTIVLWFTGVI